MDSLKVSLFFLFSLPLLLSSTNSANATEDYHKWCGETTQSEICISIISKYAGDHLKTDPAGFCSILNDKAREIAGSTLGRISDLLQGSVSSSDKELLQNAAALYTEIDYIVYNLVFSVLNHQIYPSYIRDLKKATTGVSQSKTVFGKLSSYGSSFTTDNETLGIVIELMSQILSLNECKKVETCTN